MNKHLFLYPELLSRLLFTQTLDGKYLVRATLTQQPRFATPEEIIRQIFILSLIQHYRYPEERIKLEQIVMMGRDRKRADIIVSGDAGNVELVVEVKQDIDADTIGQLRSYLMATGALLGVTVSGHEIRCFVRVGNQLSEIYDLPIYGESPGAPIVDNRQPVLSQTTLLKSEPFELIEYFERVSLNITKISIKGHTLEFANKDLTDFNKVRQRFINDGVGLGITMQRSDWLMMIESRFANATVPEQASVTHQASITNGHNDANNIAYFDPLLVESQPATGRSILDPFESFERINRVKTRITIQGRAHDFSNEDLADLKKVQRRYIMDGIVFGIDMSKSDWMDIIAKCFASAPLPAPGSIFISSGSGNSCLTHLLQQKLPDPINKEVANKSVLDLLQLAQDINFGYEDIVGFLHSSGINLKGDKVYIANNHPVLRAIFANTTWSKGWAKVLKTVEKAESTKSLRFGRKVISRAIAIPMAICLINGTSDIS